MSFNISSNICKNCFDDTRPNFMSPRCPPIPDTKVEIKNDTVFISISCEKRNFSQAFKDENEEQRYGQKITDKFFDTNIGHCVIMVQEEEKQKAQDRNSESIFQNSTDSLDENFNMDIDFDNKFQYKKPEEIDVQEIIEWCEFYQKNRNLFNV